MPPNLRPRARALWHQRRKKDCQNPQYLASLTSTTRTQLGKGRENPHPLPPYLPYVQVHLQHEKKSDTNNLWGDHKGISESPFQLSTNRH